MKKIILLNCLQTLDQGKVETLSNTENKMQTLPLHFPKIEAPATVVMQTGAEQESRNLSSS